MKGLPGEEWATDLRRRVSRAKVRLKHAWWERLLRLRLALGGAVEHVSGPVEVELGPTDLIVLCMIRNGMDHLPTFIPYYRELGARHLVFLDNGSVDGTPSFAARFDCTTVLRTELRFSRYQTALKRWLVHRFASDGGWCLVADRDELFDYPSSAELPLDGFLEYLNRQGYTAVCTHILDMVPAERLSDLEAHQHVRLDKTHRFYDLTDMRPRTDAPWVRENDLDAEGHRFWVGGIRESVFGFEGGWLTKLPLLRHPDRMRVFPDDSHFVHGARVADVNGLLRHYKYTGSFFDHVEEEVRRKQYYHDAVIFRHYQRVLAESPDLSLRRPGAREYGGAEELVEEGFLMASDRYRDWVEKRSGGPWGNAADLDGRALPPRRGA